MEKMLPRFNNMVDVSATFHVCGFWCRKSDISFDVFSGKLVSDFAPGKQSIIILHVNTHSILLYKERIQERGHHTSLIKFF